MASAVPPASSSSSCIAKEEKGEEVEDVIKSDEPTARNDEDASMDVKGEKDNEDASAGESSDDEPPRKASRIEKEGTVTRLPKSEKKRIKKMQKEEKRIQNKKRQKNGNKRRRQDKQQNRKKLLENMTFEERRELLIKEKQAVQERAAHMETAFREGKPIIVINCGFGETMNHIEHTSLAKQIQLCYGYLKTSSIPFQMHLTSLSDDNRVRSRLDNFGYLNWKMHLHEKPYWEVFPKVIVLTPDAEDELDDVDPNATYVLGGLVDKTVSKNQTLIEALGKQAVVQCLKLPLGSHGPAGCARVLNIDTVVRLLLRRCENVPWAEALEEILPQRHQMPGIKKEKDATVKKEEEEEQHQEQVKIETDATVKDEVEEKEQQPDQVKLEPDTEVKKEEVKMEEQEQVKLEPNTEVKEEEEEKVNLEPNTEVKEEVKME